MKAVWNQKLYPLVAILSGVFVIVFGLVMAKDLARVLGFSRVCVCVAHDLRVLEILSARTARIYRGCGDILRDLLCGDGNV